MLHIFQSNVFAPFAEYPLTRKFENRTLPPTILGACLVIFGALAAFNIVTQGTVPVSSSVLLQDYLSNNKTAGNTTNCQPALLRVGEAVFTSASNETSEMNATAKQPGSFKWTVNSLTDKYGSPDSVQVPYHGESLSCNMTSFGLTYYFTAQSFKYGMCAQCRAINPTNDSTYYSSTATLSSISVDLCTNYDVSVDNWPKFTAVVQAGVQAQIYLYAQVFQNLTFYPGTIPDVVYPLYNATVHNPLSDIPIAPKDVQQISTWFGAFNYTPPAAGSSPRICAEHVQCAQGTFYTTNITDSSRYSFIDTPELFNHTGWSSGLALAVGGMGNLQPFLANNGDVSLLVEPLPQIFNYTTGTASYMMDAALLDLSERSLAVTYLCTISKREWKAPWTLIAVVLGNSLGMLGAALAVMVFLARAYDRSKQQQANLAITPFQSPSPYHRVSLLRRTQTDETQFSATPYDVVLNPHTGSPRKDYFGEVQVKLPGTYARDDRGELVWDKYSPGVV